MYRKFHNYLRRIQGNIFYSILWNKNVFVQFSQESHLSSSSSCFVNKVGDFEPKIAKKNLEVSN